MPRHAAAGISEAWLADAAGGAVTVPEPTAAEDLALLFPDIDVEVRDPDSGETVVLAVREYRFIEGLRASAWAAGLIKAVAATVQGDDVSEHRIAAALGEHAETWLACIAQATGRDAAWLARLSDADGQALSVAMWQANQGFFGRRLVAALARRQKEGPSPSPKSSTPSSGPDTGADTATSPSA